MTYNIKRFAPLGNPVEPAQIYPKDTLLVKDKEATYSYEA